MKRYEDTIFTIVVGVILLLLLKYYTHDVNNEKCDKAIDNFRTQRTNTLSSPRACKAKSIIDDKILCENGDLCIEESIHVKGCRFVQKLSYFKIN